MPAPSSTAPPAARAARSKPVNGSEPVLVEAAIGPVSAQLAPFMEPEDELPDAEPELPVEELPPLPEAVVHGFFDADTLWTPDCP
jgi:hypothetical protein